jgi:N-acylglucosamine 2-epimerase
VPCSRLGADFLHRHGADEEGNFYFSLTREGEPIIEPYNIFRYSPSLINFVLITQSAPSDFFACMAFTQYAKASGQEWAKVPPTVAHCGLSCFLTSLFLLQEQAARIFHNIERRKNNPKGHWNKAHPGTRPFKGTYQVDASLLHFRPMGSGLWCTQGWPSP